MDIEGSRFLQVPGYSTQAILGEGGMATVYLAVQESLARYVALKVMKQVLVADADFCRRFLNEGRLIAKLSHPNIVTVYDIGASGGIHYLSMTYLPGGTLRDRIREGLPLDRTLHIFRRVADALGYAHARGIVHRDIKPGNVLFTDSGSPVLTDFGIAKTVGTETKLTSTGMMVGSSGYMSPEQALGQEVDHRSDLYSLGVLLWEMLTGSLPYAAQDPFALALKHATDPIPRLPGDLRRFQPVIDGLLAKKPGDRCKSVEELLRVLDEIPDQDKAPGYPAHADATVALPGGQARTPSHPTTPGIDGQPAFGPRRRFVRVTALASIAALAAIGGYLGYRGLRSPEPETLSQPALPSTADSSQDVRTAPLPATGSPPQTTTPQPVTSPHWPSERPAKVPPTPVERVRAQAAEPADGTRIIGVLLRQAEDQWKAGRLTEPQGDNAFESYSKILDLDPEHREARQRLVQIGRINAANKLFLSADGLLRQGAIDEARRMIETGLKMNPDDERLLGLARALDYAQ